MLSNSAIERLQSLRVADIMTRDVVHVVDTQTLAQAAVVFAEHDISAAPVVNQQGQCVGIFSATDFVRKASSVSGESVPGTELQLGPPPADSPTQPCDEDLVSAHMTSAVQSIAPGDSLIQAAQIMCAQHVHRLLVLNEQGKPVGVISTMDIVAALVTALDEMETMQRDWKPPVN